MIYLDHNATTPIDARVLAAMQPYLAGLYANPSGLYRAARVVRSAIDTARCQVAELLDADPAKVIFTSGGTEANNLALHSVPAAGVVAVSAVEHPSILQAAQARHGDRCLIVPADSNGQIIAKLPGGRLDLLAVMLANNEYGGIQNIAAISQQHQHRDFLIHTDATQAAGKIPVSFKQLGVDLMSVSSHKIYGPKGCGALVAAGKAHLHPQLVGGGQENSHRSGTENVPAIVGFGAAAELAKQELTTRSQHCLALRSYLEQQLHTLPCVHIFAENTARLANTCQFAVAGCSGEMLVMQLDQHNIAVSSGSACNSGGKPSTALIAMGVPPDLAKSAIRVSLGLANSKNDIAEFILVLKSLLPS